jgi:hypothetical protein
MLKAAVFFEDDFGENTSFEELFIIFFCFSKSSFFS